MENHFTKEEAMKKLGTRVRALEGAPDTGTGTVVSADEIAGFWYLRIAWDEHDGPSWYSKKPTKPR